jgi:L-ascorbate metabolism protein UlaG (beta-lactamase superfamily)
MKMPAWRGIVLAVLAGWISLTSEALSQSTASRCLAIAQTAPAAMPVAFVPAQTTADEVTIRFIGHSTFLITSPAGVTIATDYNGFAGAGVIPRVVTMNQAHSSHNTPNPDARIERVLRGWDPAGGRAEHHLQIDDVLIRNVTTDIRGWDTVRIPDGNSIFIFETARLCIGHLGHLHHVLDPADLAWLGQLDIVMAAVDGSYTMDHASMLETLKVVKARLVLPMHYFGQATLSRFLAHLGAEFAVEIHDGPQITVSPATLPKSPKVLVLPGY